MSRILRSAAVAALTLLAAEACAAQQRDGRIEGRWRVVSIDRSPVPGGTEVTIEFSQDGRVSGHSGCNRFAGAYGIKGHRLTFSPLAGTRMACPPPRMEIEARFIRALEQVTRARFASANRLHLMEGQRRRILADRLP